MNQRMMILYGLVAFEKDIQIKTVYPSFLYLFEGFKMQERIRG